MATKSYFAYNYKILEFYSDYISIKYMCICSEYGFLFLLKRSMGSFPLFLLIQQKQKQKTNKKYYVIYENFSVI